MLLVTVEEKPKDSVYLKGFYADVYHNGIWERNIEEFTEFCRKEELVPEEALKDSFDKGFYDEEKNVFYLSEMCFGTQQEHK